MPTARVGTRTALTSASSESVKALTSSTFAVARACVAAFRGQMRRVDSMGLVCPRRAFGTLPIRAVGRTTIPASETRTNILRAAGAVAAARICACSLYSCELQSNNKKKPHAPAHHRYKPPVPPERSTPQLRLVAPWDYQDALKGQPSTEAHPLAITASIRPPRPSPMPTSS